VGDATEEKPVERPTKGRAKPRKGAQASQTAGQQAQPQQPQTTSPQGAQSGMPAPAQVTVPAPASGREEKKRTQTRRPAKRKNAQNVAPTVTAGQMFGDGGLGNLGIGTLPPLNITMDGDPIVSKRPGSASAPKRASNKKTMEKPEKKPASGSSSGSSVMDMRAPADFFRSPEHDHERSGSDNDAEGADKASEDDEALAAGEEDN
jgi:hypothetical protein